MKNETKHTPGPYVTSGIPGDNHIMVLPAPHQPCAKVTVCIVPGWPGITPEEHEANKKLFASAPELLRQMDEMETQWHRCEAELEKSRRERDELLKALKDLVFVAAWHVETQKRGVAMDGKILADARAAIANAERGSE